MIAFAGIPCDQAGGNEQRRDFTFEKSPAYFFHLPSTLYLRTGNKSKSSLSKLIRF
jgi:hypothetical protein